MALWAGAMWPLGAVLGWEIVTRAPFPRGRLWQAARYGGVLTAALLAMTVSYVHAHGMLTHWGQTPLTAALGPLVIDGLMTTSGAALLALHTAKQPARRATTRRRPTARLKAA